jgi:hypothetical protein
MLMTVKEFCATHRISKALFYELLRDGRGPAVTRITSRCTRISADAAAEWRHRHEGKAGKPASERASANDTAAR